MMGSATDTAYAKKRFEDLRTICKELEAAGYDSIMVITSHDFQTEIASRKGRRFLNHFQEFLEEFSQFCQYDSTIDQEDEAEEKVDMHSETFPDGQSKRKITIETTPSNGIRDLDIVDQFAMKNKPKDAVVTDIKEEKINLNQLDVNDDDDDDDEEDSEEFDIDDEDDGDSALSEELEDDNDDEEVEAGSGVNEIPGEKKVVINVRDRDDNDGAKGDKTQPTGRISFLEMAIKTCASVPKAALPQIEKIHACQLCDKRYVRHEDLVVHMRSHTGETPFPCSICKRAFRSRQLQRQHEMVHSDTRNFTCAICGTSFSRKSYLRRHKLTHSDETQYQCVTCGVGFKDPSSYKRHCLRHEGTKKFFCEVCGKGFLGAYDLKCHKLAHTNEKPFECDICKDKYFKTKKQLTNHQRKYHIELPEQSLQQAEKVSYTCDQCGLSVSSQPALRRHKLRHEGTKTHYCGTCGKGFLGSYDLKCHQKIHTGEKPYSCEICGQTFRLGTYLNKHRRIMHHADQITVICTKGDQSAISDVFTDMEANDK